MSDQFSLFSTLLYDTELRSIHMKGPVQAGWNYQNSSPVYLLDLHRDRLLRAATHWNWPEAINSLSGPEGLTNLAEGLEKFAASTSDSSTESPANGSAERSTTLRMRIVVDRQGAISFNKSDYARMPIQTLFPTALPAPHTESKVGEAQRQDAFAVVLDSQRTDKSAYTHFKTTMRTMYDGARHRAGISLGDAREVLMVNREGFIMEGSITTVYFWRGGKWVTPRVSATYAAGGDDGGNDGITRRWALERGLVVEDSVPANSLEDGEECWLSNGARGFFCARISLT